MSDVWYEPLTDEQIAKARADDTLCRECEGKRVFYVAECGDGCCHNHERCDECGGTGYKPK